MEAAVLFAIGASFLLACRDVTGRLGMPGVDPIVGTAASALIGIPVLGLVSFGLGDFGQPWPGWNGPVLYIALAGILRITVARTLLFAGIKSIGAARAGSLSATNIFFGMLFGILFLGERLTVPIALGAALIVAGCVLLGQSRSAGQKAAGGRAYYLGAAYALLSALAFGGGALFTRMGVHAFASPNQANLFANIVGFLTYFPLLLGRPVREEMSGWSRKNWTFLLASGSAAALGVSLMYVALARAEIVFVLPIAQSRPLFVVLISWLLFQFDERVNWRVAAGAAVIAAGTVFLVAGR